LADCTADGDEDFLAGGLAGLDHGGVGRAVVDAGGDAVFGCPAGGTEVGSGEAIGGKVFVDEGHDDDVDVGVLTDVEEV